MQYPGWVEQYRKNLGAEQPAAASSAKDESSPIALTSGASSCVQSPRPDRE
jgi:hypothetical protein